MVLPTSGRVTVWRSPKEAHRPDWCMPRVKHGGKSVMVWVSWHSPGLLLVLDGRVTAKDYWPILEGHVPPNGSSIVPWRWCGVSGRQCTNTHSKTGDRVVWRTWKWSWTSPTACTVSRHQIWILLSHSPPASCSALAAVLREEWLKIPLSHCAGFVGGPTPYL